MEKITFSPPDLQYEDLQAVVETLQSGWITTGPVTRRFEDELADYCQTSRVVCLNSATAALELTLRILGIGPGDEVITSVYTYTASASVIAHVGATIVLVDTQPDGFTMDLEKLSAAITAKTKAVIAVDFAGIPCDTSKIYQVIEDKKSLFHSSNEIALSIGRIALIADSAHAFGAQRGGMYSGRLADFTCFSFHAVKNLTTAEGGAVTWNPIQGIDDSELYQSYMLLALHGQNKDALQKSELNSWEYDILTLGYKCNMTDIAAALGLSQLERYGQILAQRRLLAEQYDCMLKNTGLELPAHRGEDYLSSYHLYPVLLPYAEEKKRNDLIAALAQQGIATNVHYKPLALLTAYRQLGFQIDDYPNAYRTYCREITLPLHTALKAEQAAYVAQQLKKML